ncbi:MAG TPA: DNA-binding response regulator [Nitrospinae bacterium]|nr:DNA-binding response regulator [Nitrospinota bacterium]HBA27535.1 DNA-binding response regulator [Nitrospinota bacterium]
MRIILIEDEKQLARIVKKGLEEASYSVDVAYNGEEGLYMAEHFPADVIILDIMLPVIDGLSLLSIIRKKGVKTPVILLTAKDTISDKIKGLDTGADDYLTKPFEFNELLARIRSLLRRKGDIKEAVIRIGDMEINTASREVKRAGRAIPLSTKEYTILEYLSYKKNTVVTRTDLTEHIYDESFDTDSNIIDVYINYLRNKIDSGFKNKLIHTIRGAGYILKEP